MEVKYFRSADVAAPFRVKICDLEGVLKADDFNARSFPDFSPTKYASDLEIYGTLQIYALGQPFGMTERTTYRCFSLSPANNNSGLVSTSTTADPVRWNEWISFPVKIRDLPNYSILAITFWAVSPNVDSAENNNTDGTYSFGGTVIPLFDDKGILQSGRQKCFVWKDLQADPGMNTKTPHRPKPLKGLNEFEQILNSYNNRKLPRVDWLDKLTFRRVESVVNALASSKKNQAPTYTAYQAAGSEVFLTIELPNFKFPVIFHEFKAHEDFKNPAPLSNEVDEKSNIVQVIHDPEAFLENPIEDKYLNIQRSGFAIDEKDLKPSVYERDQLELIFHSPNKNLTQQEKSMIWRFRYSLMENEKALNKFLRCVRWNSQEESAEAAKLMHSWKKISIADALELLCPYFENDTVRDYAVKILSGASDNELQLFLLQLVQAIKFESHYPSSLSEFLISRSTQSFELANFFFWYVNVETHDARSGSRFNSVMTDFKNALNPDWADMFADREKYLVRKLVDVSNLLKGKKVEKMKEHMKQLLESDMKELCNIEPGIAYPLAPAVTLEGLVPDKCGVFKSAKAPLRLYFRSKNAKGESVPCLGMFKAGDDLRQDQLVIQLMGLMDMLWKNHGLDLKLSPYKVLATGPDDGFLELVDRSYNLSAILKDYNNRIDHFLMSQASKANQQQEILQNYVRSCAGYCVITYILGVGDRHLDNILIRETGHFFHIDFGFIFGRDPKPLPPKVRITKEMIDAMDGMNSPHYKQFISYCFQAYSILRKNAPLFLNLLSLMCASGIPDLTNDFDNTMLKVQEKFRLDLLEEEEANFHLYQVIHESLNSLTPQVMDRFHEFAMVFK